MKKIKHYLIAFLLPILIYIIAMASMNIYPFGELSWRISDSIVQYADFFEGLKNFKFFTLNLGLGSNFYPIFTTYLASPLNLLYFFFKKENFDLFFVILILLKVGLIGLTMNILLNYKREYSYKSLIFSTIYALSGFVTLYYFNYQFLDAVYMLPLVMMGLQKLVKENKYAMYYITLSLTIIIHYYTGYMVCLFSLIYFFYLLYNEEIEKKAKRKRIKTFFGISLLCGLTASFILIPTAFSFMQGRSDYYARTYNLLGINQNFKEMFFNLVPGSAYYEDLFNYSAPQFITIFVILLVLFSLFNKNNSFKKRKSLLVIMIIYILSLSFNFFYFMWHMFQKPVGLPGRFIFCFDAFFVIEAYNEYLKKKNTLSFKKKLLIIIALVFLILVSFILKNKLILYDYFKAEDRMGINLIFTILCLIIYLFIIKTEKYKAITICLVFVEIFINLIWSFNINFLYMRYSLLNVKTNDTYNTAKQNLIDDLKKDETFLRIDNVGNDNNSLSFNYFGVGLYSSFYNRNVENILKASKLDNGMAHYVSYLPSLILNSYLGVKYYILDINDEIYYQKNDYVINSLGFAVSKNKINSNEENILKFFNDATDNRYKISKQELKPKMSFKNIKYNDSFDLIDKNQDGNITYEFVIPIDCLVDLDIGRQYLYFNNEVDYDEFVKIDDIATIYRNGKVVKTLYDLKKGDIIKIEINIPKKMGGILASIKLEYVEKNPYVKLMEELNKNIITDLIFNSNGFTGKIKTTKEKNLLLLTIPYDDAIKIRIDGKDQPYEKYLNGIIGLELEEGEHFIEFEYVVKGLKIGILLSIISILIFLEYRRRNQPKCKN